MPKRIVSRGSRLRYGDDQAGALEGDDEKLQEHDDERSMVLSSYLRMRWEDVMVSLGCEPQLRIWDKLSPEKRPLYGMQE